VIVCVCPNWQALPRPGKEVIVIRTIADFAPQDAETGVGLVIQDDRRRYLFFLAGPRHYCPPGDLFYAGIGGHRETGEDWLACAHREAIEEVGSDVAILPSDVTWHVDRHGRSEQVEISDQPRPFALCEMIHPPGTPRAGMLYRIVIYKARLDEDPNDLAQDEVLGVLALTEAQVVRGIKDRPTVSDVLDGGASLVAGDDRVDRRLRLYPLGTAAALGQILQRSAAKP